MYIAANELVVRQGFSCPCGCLWLSRPSLSSQMGESGESGQCDRRELVSISSKARHSRAKLKQGSMRALSARWCQMIPDDMIWCQSIDSPLTIVQKCAKLVTCKTWSVPGRTLIGCHCWSYGRGHGTPQISFGQSGVRSPQKAYIVSCFFLCFSYSYVYSVYIHVTRIYIDYKTLEKNRCTFLNASHIHGWCAWERVRGNWNWW